MSEADRARRRAIISVVARIAPLIAGITMAVACGGAPRGDSRHHGERGRGAISAGRGSRAGASTSSTHVGGSGAAGAVPEIGCLAPTCVYHAGTDGYFACLSSGAGTCFHHGAPCAPADACMYDAVDRTYKQCSSISEGRCQRWGAACTPSSRCMFSVADGLHRTCETIAGGTCSRYGALCAP